MLDGYKGKLFATENNLYFHSTRPNQPPYQIKLSFVEVIEIETN